MGFFRKAMGAAAIAAVLFGSGAAAFAAGKGDDASKKAEAAPYELLVVFPGAEKKDMPAVADKISSLTKAKINATVKFTHIGFASWVQQTNLMLASNEKMDLMWTSSFFNYPAYVARGQVIALDDLLAKYGKDIRESLGDEVLNAARIGGKLYGIPSIRDFAADFGFVIRADLAKKHGIDVSRIKTMDDMTKALAVIKAAEPDIIAFAATQTNTIAELLGQGKYDKLSNWMGVVALDDSSLQVVNFYETKWYADTLKVLRAWYQAGYFAKGAATMKETPEELTRAGKAFSYAYSGKPGIGTQESRKAGLEMVWVPLTPPITTTSSITSGMVSIPMSAKNPDCAMQLINLWYADKDLVNAFDNGIEGKHYVKAGNTVVDYPAGVDAKNTGYTPINFRVGNNFLSYTWKGDPTDLWAQTDKFNKSAVKSKALGFSFDAEPVKTEVAAVSNVMAQYRMGLETGTLDPETTLGDYVGKLKDAGLDRIIAEKQKQINEWAKTRK